MAATRKTSPKQRDNALRRVTEVREHYRRFRVPKPGGKYFNPILDDPDAPGQRHPENIRGLAHGTLAGYKDGGCTYCERCAAASRAELERLEAARLAKRRDEHRGRVIDLLARRFPDQAVTVLADGAETVVSVGTVRQKFRALLDYQQAPVELALNNWVLVSGLGLDIRDIPDLATAIIEELST